jgi:hypothetical protein
MFLIGTISTWASRSDLIHLFKLPRYAMELLRFNEAGVEVLVKVGILNLWSIVSTYLTDTAYVNV